jgi:hypothetical protein
MCCAVDCVDATCGDKAACAPGGLTCQTHQGDTCGQATCSGDKRSSIAAGNCDGAGNCNSPDPVPCTTGYLCAGGNCPTTCTIDINCDAAKGYTCAGGQCRNLGGPCRTSDDCSVGTCVSNGAGGNICCATACTDSPPCGTMPACAPGGAACQIYASGLPCGSAGCTSDHLSSVAAGTCDGVGGCTQPPPTSCNGYVCSGVTCGLSCAGPEDCAPTFVCDTSMSPGSCLPQASSSP